MKYLMFIGGTEDDEAALSEAERAAMYERIGEWWGRQEAAGRIVGGHELHPSSTATTVRIGPGGRSSVTDGPFVEGKEMIGGYAVLDVEDLDAALRLAAEWPGEGGVLEVRPIVERGG
jgi:hypothetical protein